MRAQSQRVKLLFILCLGTLTSAESAADRDGAGFKFRANRSGKPGITEHAATQPYKISLAASGTTAKAISWIARQHDRIFSVLLPVASDRDETAFQSAPHVERTYNNKSPFYNRQFSATDPIIPPPLCDWRPTGKLSGIRDQGECGDCYLEATMCLLENRIAIASGRNATALSEQQLLDCGPDIGCNGGYFGTVVRSAALTGVCSDPDYREYNGTVGTCDPDAYGCQPQRYTLAAVQVPVLDRVAIMYAISLGAVAVGIQVDDAFESAWGKRDIYYPSLNCSSDPANPGHAVALVGYGPGYFIVRNSWGPWFGDNGYLYYSSDIAQYGPAGGCSILSTPSAMADAFPGWQLVMASGCVGLLLLGCIGQRVGKWIGAKTESDSECAWKASLSSAVTSIKCAVATLAVFWTLEGGQAYKDVTEDSGMAALQAFRGIAAFAVTIAFTAVTIAVWLTGDNALTEIKAARFHAVVSGLNGVSLVDAATTSGEVNRQHRLGLRLECCRRCKGKCGCCSRDCVVWWLLAVSLVVAQQFAYYAHTPLILATNIQAVALFTQNAYFGVFAWVNCLLLGLNALAALRIIVHLCWIMKPACCCYCCQRRRVPHVNECGCAAADPNWRLILPTMSCMAILCATLYGVPWGLATANMPIIMGMQVLALALCWTVLVGAAERMEVHHHVSLNRDALLDADVYTEGVTPAVSPYTAFHAAAARTAATGTVSGNGGLTVPVAVVSVNNPVASYQYSGYYSVTQGAAITGGSPSLMHMPQPSQLASASRT